MAYRNWKKNTGEMPVYGDKRVWIKRKNGNTERFTANGFVWSMDMGARTITHWDYETPRDEIDLSNNTTPFGLLTKKEQNHLRNWEGELEYYSGGERWIELPDPSWSSTSVYRTVSPPKREGKFVVWDGDGDAIGANDLTYAKAQRQTYGGTIYRITRNEDGSDPQIELVE